MKKILIPLLVVFAFVSACKDEAMVKGSSDAALPMPLSYGGKAEIGSRDNQVTVMKWNKYLSLGQLDSAFMLVADSLTVNMFDGRLMSGPRDSLKVYVKDMFANMKSIVINYVAAVPLNNTDKGDEWVISWTDEQYFYRDGKREHNMMHEDYRLVKGKIREISQYARVVLEGNTSK